MGIFNKIQLRSPKESTFDLSYDHKLSMKMGKLVPVHVQECLPGDKFHMASEAMFRMMPMLAPIMHKVDIFQHFFFVPNRIIWDGWENFITGGQIETVPPAFPVLDNAEMGIIAASSLADYLGIPLGNWAAAGTPEVSALPFMAYQRIWADFFRDQNLEDLGIDQLKCQDGVQDATVMEWIVQLRDRAWEHDYFTSALPWAQKGDAIELPIDLVGDLNVQHVPYANTAPHEAFQSGTGASSAPGDIQVVAGVTRDAAGNPLTIDPEGNWYVEGDDLATTTTINDLRTAWSLQKWLEKNARAGTRYVESLWAHFHVKSQDARLQRPEYLGGTKSSMAISEVLQTAQTDTTPQGNMAGHGISVSGGKTINYMCKEHGYIIGLISIRPKTCYQQGLPRHFSKTEDRYQYAWPDFAFLGEQEILNKEIMVDFGGGPSPNEGTFGYMPRYSEYRVNNSRVSGEMKTSLDFWHMGRKFDTLPSLNAAFIRCNPTNRVFAVDDPTEDTVVAHVFNKIIATRPLPKYGTPGGI